MERHISWLGDTVLNDVITDSSHDLTATGSVSATWIWLYMQVCTSNFESGSLNYCYLALI